MTAKALVTALRAPSLTRKRLAGAGFTGVGSGALRNLSCASVAGLVNSLSGVPNGMNHSECSWTTGGTRAELLAALNDDVGTVLHPERRCQLPRLPGLGPETVVPYVLS